MDRAVAAGGQAGDRLDDPGVHVKDERRRVVGHQQPQPGAPRSGTPGSGRAAAWPSWPGREPAVPGRSQRSARATTIVAATSSTPSPAAIITREETGRLGGRWSRCAALVMTPDTQSGRLGFPNLTITSAGHRLVEPPGRNRTGDPILTIDARGVNVPMRHLTYLRKPSRAKGAAEGWVVG